jgi:hypothetical protein
MTYRDQIVAAVVTTLLAANTLAGVNVYAERDWPLTAVQLPSIMVKTPAERKDSLVRGVPQFTTTAMVMVLVRATGPTSQAVAGTLADICEQIEQAVISAGSAVQIMVQQFTTVETEIRTTSDGADPLGDALVSLACEFYEIFPAPDGPALAEIGLEIPLPISNGGTLLAGVNILNPDAAITVSP